MLFNSSLLSIFLLLSAVLADHPRDDSQSQSLNLLERSTDAASTYNNKWGGAVLKKRNIETVTGTFTIPHLKGPNDSVGSAYVAIDGYVCDHVTLRAGVQLAVTDKDPSYLAWGQFYPDKEYTFDISISPGDTVQVSVSVMTSKTGVATVKNLTTGEAKFQLFVSSTPLCMQDAAWLIGKAAHGPLPNFGEVKFHDAHAGGNGKTYTPKGATIFNIKRDNHFQTVTWVHGSNVTIKYV